MAGSQFWSKTVLLAHFFLISSGDNDSKLSSSCLCEQRQDLATTHSLLAAGEKGGQDRFTVSRAKPRKQAAS